MIIVLGVLLCMLAGIAKGVQDTLAHHFSVSIFNNSNKFKPIFWDTNKSWLNKWSYLTGVKKEKFPGSSTVFVAITDAWHLAQLLHLNILILGMFIIGTQSSLWGLVIGTLLYRVVFEVNYRWILRT